MSTYSVRDDRGIVLRTTDHLSCLPDRDKLASIYDAGLILYEDGRKTTQARRRELLALSAQEKGE